ncbi:hypothetical protein [Aquimarina sp. SS2-1]|uniref:hypothetical protein n=1 Tax=Aquimarina besae TaxID=3342247 RepID=UPI00366BD7EC
MQIKQSVNRNALIIATFSFLFGTILLLIQLITNSENIIIFGLFYVLITMVLNSITLIGVLANAIVNYHCFKENLSTVLIFLLNIPIAIGYFLIVINNPFHNAFSQ